MMNKLSVSVLSLAILIGASSSALQAAPADTIARAWEKALEIAAAGDRNLTRPEVFFDSGSSGSAGHMVAEYVPFAHEVRVYKTQVVPLQSLMIHEFLHAIYYRIYADSITLAGLAQQDPSEPWVQECMDRGACDPSYRPAPLTMASASSR